MNDLIERLKKRAEAQRQIMTLKSVQVGEPDTIADLLEEAAASITTSTTELESVRALFADYLERTRIASDKVAARIQELEREVEIQRAVKNDYHNETREIAEVAQRLQKIVALAKHLQVDSEPAFEDERLSYVEVQLDPDVRKEFLEALKELKPGDLGEYE